MIREYYWLMKPGIIYGNTITAVGGYFLASKGVVDFKLFFAMIFGLAFVIGSACVFNNYIDRDIDLKMNRTKHRALAVRSVSTLSAMIFATVLLLAGIFLLWKFTTLVALSVGLVGFVVYVFVYSPLKHRTVYATLVGSISGATPPVVGYTAVTNHLDLGAWLLFIILVLWQMPHFYAIAIYRFDDYVRASIPVLPARKGFKTTKIHMIGYTIAFLFAMIMLTLYNYTGYFYLSIMLLLGLAWVWFSIKGLKTEDHQLWAKKMFRFSLIVLLTFSVLISIDVV